MNKVELNPKVDKEFKTTQDDSSDKEEAELELISPDPLPEEPSTSSSPSPKKLRRKKKEVTLAPRKSRRLRQRNRPENFYQSNAAKVNAYYLTLDHLDDNLVHVQLRITKQ